MKASIVPTETFIALGKRASSLCVQNGLPPLNSHVGGGGGNNIPNI